jgi:hypothetical protein
MTSMTGHSLHRLLVRLVDAPTFDHVITPVFADLDYEIGQATTVSQRWIARVQCYAAIARIALTAGVRMQMPIKRLVITLALSVAGAGTMIWLARTNRREAPMLGVFIALGVLAPIALRGLQAGRTFRELALSLLTIGWVTTVPVFIYAYLQWDVVTSAKLLMTLANFGVIGMACILIAAVASIREPRRESVVRQSALALLFGVVCSTLVAIALRLWISYPAASGFRITWVAGALVQAITFALAAALFLVPLVVLVRRRIKKRWLLALLSGMAFPIPLFAVVAVVAAIERNGEILARWFSPLAFTVFVLPFIAACAGIGWVLSRRNANAEPSVSRA